MLGQSLGLLLYPAKADRRFDPTETCVVRDSPGRVSRQPSLDCRHVQLRGWLTLKIVLGQKCSYTRSWHLDSALRCPSHRSYRGFLFLGHTQLATKQIQRALLGGDEPSSKFWRSDFRIFFVQLEKFTRRMLAKLQETLKLKLDWPSLWGFRINLIAA